MKRRPFDVGKIRRARGWTQAELAERLGVDVMTVSRWERKLSSPRASTREAIEGLASTAEPPARAAARRSSATANGGDEYAGIDELVRIVGVVPALRALRRLVLLRTASVSRPFPVEATARLREVESALREQLDLISRARIG
jgi:transcriptional regulator with XRE-family HTH domain